MDKHTNDAPLWSSINSLSATISLYEEEWRHIVAGHPNMKNQLGEIQKTVIAPDTVYTSGEYDDRDVYFRQARVSEPSSLTRWTKVVVQNQSNNTGYIVTAFRAKKEGGNVGRKIYP